MAHFTRLPVGLRRRIYRLAHALLRIYWFVRRPDCDGVKCLLTHGDRVLLVVHTYGEAVWELPGGSIRSGEEPLQAARREMKEELGVDIENWVPLGELSGQMQYRRDTVHCFQAELSEPALTLDLGELQSARWFTPDELPADVGRYVRPILARREPAPGS